MTRAVSAFLFQHTEIISDVVTSSLSTDICGSAVIGFVFILAFSFQCHIKPVFLSC